MKKEREPKGSLFNCIKMISAACAQAAPAWAKELRWVLLQAQLPVLLRRQGFLLE
jgi:hypothetical protein